MQKLKGATRSGSSQTMVFAVALGIAVFYAIDAVVSGLIGPLIAVFIGKPDFELNSFSINGSEFRYGAVLLYLIAAALTAMAVFAWSRWGSDRYWPWKGGQAPESRQCPKCTLEIPIAAKRCPYCTEILEPQEH